MRQKPETDCIYHIYNRGNNKQKIFKQKYDMERFRTCMFLFQFASSVKNIARIVQHSMLHKPNAPRLVEIMSFCLMPNHFHIQAKQLEENGISKWMQRLQNSYTKYYNKRYKHIGHLFQGAYKAKECVSEMDTVYVSAYIHKNSKELADWNEKFEEYSFSSYKEYLGGNHFDGFLNTNTILTEFKTVSEYQSYVNQCPVKDGSDV